METKKMRFGITILFLALLAILPPPVHGAEKYEHLIAQGIEAINEGHHAEALKTLSEALRLAPDNPEANYYAGIAASRLGNLDLAEDLLKKTLDFDENSISAYMELMRIYYLTSRCDRAESIFNRYIDLSKDQALIRDARELLAQCGKKPEKKPYSVKLLVGAQDDTNVLLEPSNPPSPEDRRSDNRLVAQLDASARLLHSKAFDLDLDYALYQSLHRDLIDFNVLYQKISPSVTLHISDRFIPSAGYSFDYTYFRSEDYGRTHTGFGKIRIPEGDSMATDLIYEYRDKTYWDTTIFPTNAVRRGHENSLGIKQHLITGGNLLTLFYLQDWERTDADYWAFNGYRAGAKGISAFGPWYVTFGGEFHQRRYRDDFPVFNNHRFDRTQQYSFGITYRITKKVGISVTESYLINESNLDAVSNPDAFDYKRNVAGIFLRWGIL